MTTLSDEEWREVGKRLAQPFDPSCVDFRPQGKPGKTGKVQAVCYIDARTVADRLDDVVEPGAWEFTYEPLVTANGQVQIAKGRLTIHGVTKEDVGEASNFDPSKGCVSDALKRAAVLWGIGRYLYGIGGEWVTPDDYGRITPADVQRLRAKLPTPNGQTPARPASPPARRDAPQTPSEPSTRPQATPAPSQRVSTQDTPIRIGDMLYDDEDRRLTPAVDPMALTHASVFDQKRLSGQLAARFHTSTAQANFLRSVTEREIDPADVLTGRSDLSVIELAKISERLTRIPAANGKAAR